MQQVLIALRFYATGTFQRVKAGFTSDGVAVGVVIGSVERYDLVKIKLTESEAEPRIHIRLRRLRSSEN